MLGVSVSGSVLRNPEPAVGSRSRSQEPGTRMGSRSEEPGNPELGWVPLFRNPGTEEPVT